MATGVEGSSQQKQLAEEIMETLNQFTNLSVPISTPNSDPQTPAVVFETSPSDGWHRSPSSSSSYNDEWDWLVGGRSPLDLESHLADCSLQGMLRSCRFRSVCWKVHLGVLSGDRTKWRETTERWRRLYDDLSQQFVIDPRLEEKQEGHPLSLEYDSAWHRFFEGQARKDEIMKDVTRTFPDIGFFQTPLAQRTMINVLFIFSNMSRLHYRQGMHELLAPIIFVLHSDHLAFQHASEQQGDPDDDLQCLLDERYLEHDAYAVFSQLMKVGEQWYIIDECPSAPTVLPEPFSRPGQSSSIRNCPAIIQLSRIHNERLRRADLVLYEHLERLEVVPQLYGIRWLRLLFGREFPLQDLLVMWDAIFATCLRSHLEQQSTTAFPLVDHIFVVMLVLLSDLLLRCDFSQAVMHLMNYPLHADVHTILGSALHTFRPEVFPKTSARAPVAHRANAVRRTQSAVGPLEGLTARLRTMNVSSKLIRFGEPRERPKSLMVGLQTELQRLTVMGPESAPATPVRMPRRKMRSSRSAERLPGKAVRGPAGDFVEILTDEEERRQLAANLRATLHSVEKYRQLTRRAGNLVEHSLDRVQNVMRLINGHNERQIEALTLAVADLKKARDYLRGSLSITSGEAIEDDSAEDALTCAQLASEVELKDLK